MWPGVPELRSGGYTGTEFRGTRPGHKARNGVPGHKAGTEFRDTRLGRSSGTQGWDGVPGHKAGTEFWGTRPERSSGTQGRNGVPGHRPLKPSATAAILSKPVYSRCADRPTGVQKRTNHWAMPHIPPEYWPCPCSIPGCTSNAHQFPKLVANHCQSRD